MSCIVIIRLRPADGIISFSASAARWVGNILIGQGRVGDDADQRAFQFANVGVDLIGDVHHRFVRNVEIFRLRFLAQNGDPRLQVRRLNIGDQSPFEPGAQPFFQCRNFLRRTVAGNDDLLMFFMQRIKCMEKFLLGPFFSG